MKWTTRPPAATRMPGDAAIDDAEVIRRLEEAGDTMMRLPMGGGDLRMRNFWPEIVRDKEEAYGYNGAEVRPARPSAAAITRMDAAFALLAHIPNDRFVLRRIVGLRALVNPTTGRHLWTWTRIALVIGSDRRAVAAWHAQGVALIVQSCCRKKNTPGSQS